MILCLCDECAVSGAIDGELTYGGHMKPACDGCCRGFTEPLEQAHHYRLSRIDVERSLRHQPPMQPLIRKRDVIRFQQNTIVRYLLNNGGVDLNGIAINEELFNQQDFEQFYQLIGYSLCGYHELSFVSDETALEASRKARESWENVGGCRDDGCEFHTGVEREE